MRQAGRYLPEYREIRSRVSFEELCRDPELCAEVTLQPLERFGMDAAILFSDILTVFDAMGVEVRFDPGPTVLEPVRTPADVERLRFGEVEEHLGYVADAVRACRAALAGRVPLIGFCGGPLTTISYLIEGGSSRDFEPTKAMMLAEGALFGRLMESMTTLLSDYLAMQVRAGAEALQIFDSWAGALAPRDYRDHVLRHMRDLIDALTPLDVPIIVFARGNAELLEQIRELGSAVIGIDWTIDLERAIEVVGENRVVQGNLDPAVLLSTPEMVTRRAREVVAAGRRARAHVFNLGHGISRNTDPAMVQLLVDVVHEA
jgi:uroporphyrinogen decarboxylase